MARSSFRKFIPLLLLTFFFIGHAVMAQSDDDPFGLRGAVSGTGVPETTITGQDSIIATVIFNILGIVGVVFLIFIVWGGIMWMVSGGNDQRITRAKAILTTAIIGLFIVMTAYATTYFIVQSLTGIQAPEQPVEMGT